MKTRIQPPTKLRSSRYPAAFILAGAITTLLSASAATYTWSGGTSVWTDATATGWSGGPPVAGDTATINGGLVNFANHDTFGNAGTTTSASINLNGGTLASNGFFTTIWNLNLNGGTLLANGGAAAAYPAFQLAGTVTVGGTQMSTINATTAVNANNQINIGGNGNLTLTFNVADVTGNANPDLTINATLQNNPFGAGSLTKTGAGTLTLTGANTYTGTTTVSAGTLNVTGSYTPGVTTGSVFVANGGSLTFAMGAGTANFYGDGYASSMQIGEASTGTLTLQSGTVNVNTLTGGSTASLRLGNGNGANGSIVVNGGALNVPGRILIAANGAGTGTLTINGGAVNMGTVGSGSYADPGSGVLWFGGGTSTVNLNGGTLALYSLWNQGNGAVTVNLNGGTLKAIADNTQFVAGTLTMKVQAGGAVIDTSTFGITIATALVHDAALGATPDGGLAKNGTGTLTLSGANTFSGVTTINAGTLNANSTSALGNGSSTNTLIFTGGTLQAGGTITSPSTRTVTLTSTGLIDTNSNAVSIAGIMSGAGGLTKNGLGTLTLSGANTYTGATYVNAGTLVVDGGTIAGPGLMDIGANAATPANFTLNSGSVTVGGQFVIGAHGSTGTAAINGGTLQVNAPIYIGGYGEGTGTGTITQTGGTVTTTVGMYFGGNGPNNGIYNLNGGTLTTTGLDKNGTGTATFNFNGGTLRPSVANATFLQGLTAANVLSGGAIIDTNTFNITIAQPLLNGGGGGGLTKSGLGTMTLSGANTYTGTTTVSNGRLVYQNTYASASHAIAAGATLEINVASGTRNSATTTFSGGGTLVQSGAGTLVWGAGAATFALGAGSLIDVQGGTFTGGSSANEVWTNNLSSLNVATGAIFNGVEANVRVDALTGAGTIQSGYNGAGYVNFTFGVNNGSGTFSGVLANSVNAGSFVKTGTGTQTLSGANSYTGATTINGGRLVYQNTYASASHVIASGATLEFNVASGGLDGGTTTFSGGGTIVKSGGGDLYWSASAATFAMGAGSLIDVQAGTFGVGFNANENMTNSLADLNVAGGASFNSGGCNAFVNALTGSGTIRLAYDNNNPRTMTIGVNNGGGTFSGAITDGGIGGNGNVVKTGTGTQTLSGTNTYTGTTNVTGGTLAISGSISGSTTLAVNNGGTLLLGAVNNVKSGADLNLGGGTGATSGGIVQIGTNLGTNTSAATESFGALTLSFDSTLDFGTSAAGTGVKLFFTSLGAHTPTTGADLAILGWTGTDFQLGSDATDRLIFTGATTDFTGKYAQADVSFNGIQGYSAIAFGSNQYEIVAIPEPSTWLAAAGLLGLVGYRERRRFRRQAV